MTFKPVRIAGTHRQVGVALGKLARPLMSAYLDQSTTWRALRPWRGHAYLQVLSGHIQRTMPAVWEEFAGMADGLKMPLDDVLLWNCRGDLLRQTTDGCTSIALYGAIGQRWIAHNEDGDPYLYGRCHLVDVQLADAPGYVSFYYPGSLPGHSFGMNQAGIVQTINNLRPHVRGAGVPRMFLARAVLDCASLGEAIALLHATPRAGAFHHTLGAVGDDCLFSVEVAPSLCSIVPIERRYGHANHMIHAANQSIMQRITESSRARQHRVDRLLDNWAASPDEAAPLVTALHDTEGELPILRTDPADPDGENTLATAVFSLHDTHVDLYIHDRKGRAVQHIVVTPAARAAP